MDVFEAHKYLDPTTLDDSSFLSFSSFADLTRSPYDDYLDPTVEETVNNKQEQHYLPHRDLQPQPFGLYQSFELATDPITFSTPTPPSSHSDSDSESPPTPYHPVSCSGPSSSFTPQTPSTQHDYGTLYTPLSSPLINRGGPSRYSTSTTTPSRHVSHRSTSSSSDWNSPVTPSLTYKSSVDSLASFAPEPDFFLPPSSTHTAFGWDNQSLGSSSSSLTLRSSPSPPSPSPHRVASNPTLGKNRHPRSIAQVKSLPSLREEGAPSMEANNNMYGDEIGFAEFMNTYTNLGSSPVAAGTVYDAIGGSDLQALIKPTSELAISQQSTANGTAPNSTQTNHAELFAPFLAPSSAAMSAAGSAFTSTSGTTSSSSTSDTIDLESVDWNSFAAEPYELNGQSAISSYVGAQYTVSQTCDYGAISASQPPTLNHESFSTQSLAVPGSRNVSQSMPSTGAMLNQSPNINWPQVLSDPFVQSSIANDIDPALMGMTSEKPLPIPSPDGFDASRRGSQSLGIDLAAMFQSQGPYASAPMTAPYALQSQQGYGSLHPMHLQPESSTTMMRNRSDPVRGNRAQSGSGPVNVYRGSFTSATRQAEAVRQRTMQPQAEPRRLSMAEASVMQPYIPIPLPPHPDSAVNGQYHLASQQQYHQLHMQQQQQQQQLQQLIQQQRQRQQQQQQQQQVPMQYSGWSPSESFTPSTQYVAPPVQRNVSMGSGPMTTHAYGNLGNVHPPANSFHPNSHPVSRVPSAPVPHIVHPPPHPGSVASGSGSAAPAQQQQQQQQRTFARLPSGTPTSRGRKANGPGSAKQKTRTPGGRKNAPKAGITEHNGIWFAQYTAEDAQALLNGVAPSGSQSKRKRQADAELLSVAMTQAPSGSDISGDEDSRSKRSRSEASSSFAQ